MKFRVIATWSAALLLGIRPAAALDPNTRITQYFHSAWRVQDGAFESAPNAVAQTADGYIWIGTSSGLVKYDGVRFARWEPPPGKSLPNPNVISLLGSSDGALWIGTAGGLFRWKDNDLREHLRYRINRVLEDHAGTIWVARSRSRERDGGLCQITGQHPRCIGADERMNLPSAVALAEDVHGNLWVGGACLLRWREGSYQEYFRNELARRTNLGPVESIAAASDGSVWVSVPAEKKLGLIHIIDGHPKRVALAGIKTRGFGALLVDRAGSLWLGSSDSGLYRLNGGRVDHFGGEDGLSSNGVSSLFEDREGNFWVATSQGLDCFRDKRILTFSSREGLLADLAESVLASHDGTVWVGNRGGLNAIRDGNVTSISVPGARVTALLEDHANRLWVGIDDKLTIYEQGRFHEVNRPDGSPVGVTTALAEDREHNIWAVANPDRKLLRIRNLRVQEEFTEPRMPITRTIAADPAGGIWLGFLDSFGHYRAGHLDRVPSPGGTAAGPVPEPDGSVWVATRNGLIGWKDRRAEVLASKNGLPCDLIYSAIRDDHARLWLYTRCGLIGIANSELERWWSSPGSAIRFQMLDALDGAMPYSSTFHPSVTKAPDGRLWFVNDSVVQVFDPNRGVQKGPPPVYIEQVRADRKEYGNRPAQLPPNTRDIEISYTALSYSIPQRVRFRYKLDRRDREWQDAGTRRQAFYNDLPPGGYRFQVTASDSDGVWNEAGALVEFSIAPAYYQTAWFRASMVGLVIVGLWALYRIRLHQLAREFNAQLDGRVDERLRVARELHDTMLQTFQASLIHMQAARNRLARGDETAVKNLEDAIRVSEGAVAEARSAIQGMRASITMTNDLARALQQIGYELASEGSATFHVVVEGTSRVVHPILRDEVYGVAREAIRNAFRHAQANAIEVEIAYADSLRVRIRDDGKGIDPAIVAEGRSGHYGLAGMRERAARIGGRLDVWSAQGAGTEIELSIPGSKAYSFSSSAHPLTKLFRRRNSESHPAP